MNFGTDFNPISHWTAGT